MLGKLLAYIRERDLVRAGDRVGVAVSGGADSVALLRGLVALRDELGAVLSVVHLHHGIRAAEADDDAAYVAGMAQHFDLQFHTRHVDVPAIAAAQQLGIEAAGRKLRYEYFCELMATGVLDKVATAHTADDQAETVLLRTLRGAGSRGLSGIYPRFNCRANGVVIRPLLHVSRHEIEDYLRGICQPWREDITNRDRRFLRNRLRHELLPMLERDYNPSVRRVLNEAAEISRAEEEFWDAEIQRQAAEVLSFTKARATIHLAELTARPLAVQRRLIRHAIEHLDLTLDFHHIEEIRDLANRDSSQTELPAGWLAERRRGDLVIYQPVAVDAGYSYLLPIPGEVVIPEVHLRVRASLVEVADAMGRYNPAALLDPGQLPSTLVVRNWHAGDRFHPLRSRSPEKLKRLLLEKKVVQPEKASWPVAASGDVIVWVRGFPVAAGQAFKTEKGRAVLIEELPE